MEHPFTPCRRHVARLALARLAPVRLALVRLALVLVALLALRCSDGPSEPITQLPVRSLVRATLVTHLGPPLREVVRDEARWLVVWGELWGPSPPARPAIDFAREMVVVATASLSCFGDVEIESVRREPGGVVVGIRDASPPPLCLCVQGEYVFHVAATLRVDGGERFDVRASPARCG